MKNNDTSGIMSEDEVDDLIEKKGMGGLNKKEMKDLLTTMGDLFSVIDWDKVADGKYEDDEEDTQ